jgi:hypothetical protein
MKKYLETNELGHRPKMKAWVVVVIGEKVEVCQEVFL